jgi:hypothetical protein
MSKHRLFVDDDAVTQFHAQQPCIERARRFFSKRSMM